MVRQRLILQAMYTTESGKRKWKLFEISLLYMALSIECGSTNPLEIIESLFQKTQSSQNVGNVELIAQGQYTHKVGFSLFQIV